MSAKVRAEVAVVPQPPVFAPSAGHTESRLLTADELAVRWQVAPAHVYRLTRQGDVPAVKLGRYYRYRLAVIEAFETAGGVSADA